MGHEAAGYKHAYQQQSDPEQWVLQQAHGQNPLEELIGQLQITRPWSVRCAMGKRLVVGVKLAPKLVYSVGDPRYHPRQYISDGYQLGEFHFSNTT